MHQCVMPNHRHKLTPVPLGGFYSERNRVSEGCRPEADLKAGAGEQVVQNNRALSQAL
ncbi:protein of unknown function [Candidatus Filomicrobium marinum]|uniref:Uncharacterized protein n=1 Tax=Candidatus Filomicrobium marinum TaxID=1608628 RepID=A0A0D6JJC2_9HYPH|nr:protein of unknown function [Candidatus Filomicrobium marinum]CPR21743.1 protein of unknown function [Candidatus Filomicrobium marinum]